MIAFVAGWLFDATVKGSVLIVLVALTQVLLARRVPAKWRHLLWLIVLVRLALPAAPSSSFSIFNLIPDQTSIPLRTMTVAPIPAPPMMLSPGVETFQLVEQRTRAWTWIIPLWLIGALALMLRALIATWRCSGALRRAGALKCAATRDVVDQAKRDLGITREVRVVETDIVKAPALHGLFHPTLLLPPGLASSFDRDELRHVVLHELWHLRRFDVPVNWLLAAVQAVHWFNPFVWFAIARIQEEREVACDELALSCLEEEERIGYGRTILKLLERFRAPAPVPALVGIVNHKQKMKRRLTMIATFKNRSRFSILFLAVVAAVGALGLTDASGGGDRHFIRKIDPAAIQTIDRLDQRVSFDLKNASLNDLFSAVSTKTGVTITQAPEIATSSAQQARFTLHVDNVPAHAVLMETLMPFKLAPQPDANGVTIGKGEACGIMIDEDVEQGDGGTFERKIVRHTGHVERAEVAAPAPGEPGTMEKRVFIRSEGPVECKIKADGSLHRELTLNMEENGVKSVGKLVLDIAGARATQ